MKRLPGGMVAMNYSLDLHGWLIPESHDTPALSRLCMKLFALMIKIS